MFETILSYIYEYLFFLPFSTIYQWTDITDQSIVYPFALIIILAWALIVLISKSFSYTSRIGSSCDRVNNYLKKLDKKSKKKGSTVSNEITLENEAEFEKFNKKCFGKSCNKNLKDRWAFYLKNQQGLPSEFITSDQCLNRHSVGRGINRGRVLAFRYGAFFISLVSFIYSFQFCIGLGTGFDVLPGFITLLCITLLFDLLINWVFTRADNSTVNSFYRMVNALDNQAAVYKDNVPYAQYYQDYQEYDDGYAQDTYAQEGEYADEQYAEADYTADTEYVEEPVYEEAPQQEYYDTTEEQYYDDSNEVYEEPVYEEPVYEEPVYEEPVAPVAPVEPAPTANEAKMKKIDALVDKAIASNANKQTYLGLAKMLIAASKTVSNEQEKAQLKACASKLMAKIK